MKLIVRQIFNRLGVNNISVDVRPITKPVAWAIGINPEGFLSIPVTGVIYVDNSYLQRNRFTKQEIIFLLAHECGHIFRNHIVSRIGWYILESVAKGPQNKNYNIVEMIKAILALFSPNLLPPNVKALRC